MTFVCCALAAVACLAMVLLDTVALSIAALSVTGLCHFLNHRCCHSVSVVMLQLWSCFLLCFIFIVAVVAAIV